MPLTLLSNPKRNPRFRVAALLTALLLVCLSGLADITSTNAQRGARRTRQRDARPTPAQQDDGATTPAARQKAKKVVVGGSSDTGQGSRVTITSDEALNDYSAYRSGDRFNVVLPKAAAASIPKGMSGRGFSDVQVQQRGEDVVLSYRLKPGAKPRVEQKFNRLNVIFDAPEGGAAPANTEQGQQQAVNRTPRAANDRRAAAATTAAMSPAQPAASSSQPADAQAARNAGAQPAQSAPSMPAAQPGAVEQPFSVPQLPTSLPASESAQATPSEAPAAEPQMAQVVAPASAGESQGAPTAAPSTQPGVSFGTVLLRNWPLALTLALVLVGVGLFFAARRAPGAGRRAAEPDRLTVRSEKPQANERSPELVEAKEAIPPGAHTATATAASSSAVEAVDETPTEADSELSGEAAPAIPAGEAVAAEETAEVEAAADESAEAGETAEEITLSQRPEEVAAATDVVAALPADSDQVQAEVKRLLDGDTYDKKLVGSADVVTRGFVAAELLSALAGRNPARRERSRRAFIEHGYFNEAAHDLRFGATTVERVSGARSLGLSGDRTATSHLIAALEDPATEVRRAAVEALASLSDPKALEPLKQLREREKKQKVKIPRHSLRHAIDVCAAGVEEKSPVAAEPATEVVATVSDVVETSEVESAPAPTQEFSPANVSAAEAPPEVEDVAVEEPASTAPEVVEGGESEPEDSAPESTYVAEAEAHTSTAVEPYVQEEWAADLAEEATSEASAPVATHDEVGVEKGMEVFGEESVYGSAREETLAEPVAKYSAPEVESPSAYAGVEERFATTEIETIETPVVAESEVAAQSLESSTFKWPAVEAEQPAESGQLEYEEAYDEADSASEVVPTSAETKEIQFVSPSLSFWEEAGPEESAASEGLESDSRELELFNRAGEEGAANAAVEEPETQGVVAGETEEESWVEFDLDAASPATYEGRFEEEAPKAVEPYAPSARVEEDYAPSFDATATFERSNGEAASPETESDASTVHPSFENGHTAAAGEKGIETFDEFSTVPKAIQLRLNSEEPAERAEAVLELAHLDGDNAFRGVCAAFNDRASEVRNAAARALYDISDDRADSFTRALRESDPETRRNIGYAISSSGLASEALGQLTGESREKTYEAFSLLFLMAKAGEVQPLIRAIEGHPDNEVRLAVVKLLALSGQKDVLPAFRRLAVRGSLPAEVRSAVMEAIYQMSGGQQDAKPTV